MKLHLNLLLKLAMLLTATTAAAQGPDSGFAEFCGYISISGNILSAECLNDAGQYTEPSLDIDECIENLHGDLGVCYPVPRIKMARY